MRAERGCREKAAGTDTLQTIKPECLSVNICMDAPVRRSVPPEALKSYNGSASRSCRSSRRHMGFSPIHRARFSQLPTILLALTVGGSLAAPKAYAQQAEPSAPAHLAFVEGDALLDREDRTEAATGSVPFVPGDRLRTQAGRAEVLFPDGSALEVD